MSDDVIRLDADESVEEQPERKFCQEDYDLLTKGQGPWLTWRRENPKGDWSAFEKDHSQEAQVITKALAEWNRTTDGAALLEGAELVSYGALGVALAMIHGVDFLNRYTDLALGIPDRTGLLLVSSMFLMVGSTIYKLACPPRVQTFSETEWVEEHGHPRLQYLAESLRRRWQVPTAVFTGVGGVLAIWLLADRLWFALRIIWSALGK